MMQNAKEYINVNWNQLLNVTSYEHTFDEYQSSWRYLFPISQQLQFTYEYIYFGLYSNSVISGNAQIDFILGATSNYMIVHFNDIGYNAEVYSAYDWNIRDIVANNYNAKMHYNIGDILRLTNCKVINISSMFAGYSMPTPPTTAQFEQWLSENGINPNEYIPYNAGEIRRMTKPSWIL